MTALEMFKQANAWDALKSYLPNQETMNTVKDYAPFVGGGAALGGLGMGAATYLGGSRPGESPKETRNRIIQNSLLGAGLGGAVGGAGREAFNLMHTGDAGGVKPDIMTPNKGDNPVIKKIKDDYLANTKDLNSRGMEMDPKTLSMAQPGIADANAFKDSDLKNIGVPLAGGAAGFTLAGKDYGKGADLARHRLGFDSSIKSPLDGKSLQNLIGSDPIQGTDQKFHLIRQAVLNRGYNPEAVLNNPAMAGKVIPGGYTDAHLADIASRGRLDLGDVTAQADSANRARRLGTIFSSNGEGMLPGLGRAALNLKNTALRRSVGAGTGSVLGLGGNWALNKGLEGWINDHHIDPAQMNGYNDRQMMMNYLSGAAKETGPSFPNLNIPIPKGGFQQ